MNVARAEGPRTYAIWWAALVYGVCAMSLGYPALAGRFLLNVYSDQYIAGYAFRQFAAEQLRAGHGFPQWNPYFFGGMPFVAAMHGDIFYPTFLLRLVMPTDVAITWEFIIHMTLAGLFTYGFLRAWGLSFFPALLGGLAYMMSGWVASYASPGHDGKLFVSTLLPLGLWFLLRGMRDGRPWAWGALALTVGLAVLSPHPQLLQYMLLTCSAFALFVAFGPQPDGTRLERRVALARLALALGAVVLGGLIGAVQYLPVREYVAWSPRAGGVDYAFATSYSFPPEELINVYLPQFSGILLGYWGRNLIHFHSEYAGVVVLFLAGLAFGSGSRTAFARFWLGVLVVSLFWSLGGYTLFFQLIYAVVPGTRFFRAPSSMFVVTVFATSMLAALGAERLLDGRATLRYAVAWAIAGIGVALLATAGGVTNLAMTLATAIGSSYPAAYAQSFLTKANDNHVAVVVGAWRCAFFVVLASAVILLYGRGRLSAVATAWLLTGATAVDLWSIDRLYWQFMAPATTIFAPDAIIDSLKHQTQPGRVLVLQNRDAHFVPRDPYMGTDGYGRGAGFMVHGIRSVTGYHANELARYQTIGGKDDADVYERSVSPQFWRHENVRWLYTDAPVPDTALRPMVGPVLNSAGSTVYLYRLPGEHPYAWLATVAVAAPDTVSHTTVLNPRYDPNRVAVFDTSAHIGVKTLTTLPPPAGDPATVDRYGPGMADISFVAPSPRGAALVVAENFYPGWHALADGKPARVGRAEYNLIGVALPPGTQHVQLRFTDRAYELGKWVTWMALALAGAWLALSTVPPESRRHLESTQTI